VVHGQTLANNDATWALAAQHNFAVAEVCDGQQVARHEGRHRRARRVVDAALGAHQKQPLVRGSVALDQRRLDSSCDGGLSEAVSSTRSLEGSQEVLQPANRSLKHKQGLEKASERRSGDTPPLMQSRVGKKSKHTLLLHTLSEMSRCTKSAASSPTVPS